MKSFLPLAFVWIATLAMVAPVSAEQPLFELRIYDIEPGKQGTILQFMKDEGFGLAKSAGLDVVAAFVPVDEQDSRIVTLVRHKDRATCDATYEKMQSDPKVQAAFVKAFPNGAIPIKSVARVFMETTDYSPELAVERKGDRVFELRTYIASPKNLSGLDARFRDHTVKLFSKHGMTNVIYWHVAKDSPLKATEVLAAVSPKGKQEADIPADLAAVDNTLIYFLAHRSEVAAKESFDKFRTDAVWNQVRTASEEKAGGSLTAGNAVKSWFLKPAEFSPLQ